MIAAQNATDFETVPGFVDRRRSHMSDVNNQNYAEHLSPDKAVFPYVEVRPIPYLTHLHLPKMHSQCGRHGACACSQMGHGPMAGLLERTSASPPNNDSMAPRGRSRAGDGFFEVPRQ